VFLLKICILSSFEDSMMRDSGPSVRIYNLAKGLAAAGNDVKVVMPSYKIKFDFVDQISVCSLKGIFPAVMLKAFSKLLKADRFTALYFYDVVFVSRALRLIRDADVVQFEQQFSGGLLIPFIKKVLRKPVVVDCHDVFQAIRVKHTSILRRILETFLEKLAYRNADLTLTVSESEKKILASFLRNGHIEVVPNGVDTKSFVRTSDTERIKKQYGLCGFHAVVFVGNLDYPPNRRAIELLSKIAQRVHKEIRNTKFLMVGKTQKKIEMPGFVFTGFLNNLTEILSVSDVAVAPLLQGSGTRLKILEYLSCGLPVVSTSIAAEGLEIENGKNIFIEDDPEKFAVRTIELLRNKELSAFIGNRGRKLAVDIYDWKGITRKLERSLCGLMSNS
jgi:glycosyltransferase involved in cell wall biosynthesis